MAHYADESFVGFIEAVSPDKGKLLQAVEQYMGVVGDRLGVGSSASTG
jgi:hypothetical protein